MGVVSSKHGRDDQKYAILFGNPKGRDYLENIGIDVKIVLEWILGYGMDAFGSA
jgi:hypothetical protein